MTPDSNEFFAFKMFNIFYFLQMDIKLWGVYHPRVFLGKVFRILTLVLHWAS